MTVSVFKFGLEANAAISSRLRPIGTMSHAACVVA
eukprot:CAMPEP_0114569700 /NCGR_PEP_ID=MMETSP0114-20121206/16779_1 /TAXON_ID=31324 /ORGANISM="Goniomonas sp, Strain m" /LENGTH=34 /DNA_ID= /DNA_START= /DNA_END= /DNA_ORIENTATION=